MAVPVVLEVLLRTKIVKDIVYQKRIENINDLLK